MTTRVNSKTQTNINTRKNSNFPTNVGVQTDEFSKDMTERLNKLRETNSDKKSVGDEKIITPHLTHPFNLTLPKPLKEGGSLSHLDKFDIPQDDGDDENNNDDQHILPQLDSFGRDPLNFIESMKLFFGPRDHLSSFLSGIYCHRKYNVSANDDPNNPFGCSELLNIMYAKFYENKQIDRTHLSEYDIHPDFTSSIIMTAMWHFLIDPPSGLNRLMLKKIPNEIAFIVNGYELHEIADRVRGYLREHNLDNDVLVNNIHRKIDEIIQTSQQNDPKIKNKIAKAITSIIQREHNFDRIDLFVNKYRSHVQKYIDEFVQEYNYINTHSKEFYETHLTIKKFNNDNNRFVKSDNLSFGKKIYRADLNKDNNSNTTFSKTLPLVPQKTGNIYYYDSNGDITRVNFVENNKSELFRDIYNYIYDPVSDNFNFIKTYFRVEDVAEIENIFDSYYNTFNFLNKLIGFQFDAAAMFKDTVEKTYEELTRGICDSSSSVYGGIFGNTFTDLGANVKYGRDEKGLYRLDEKNQKIHTEKDKLKCVLGGDDDSDDECKQTLAKCIANGDYKNLAFCLGDLPDANFFDLAGDELVEAIQDSTNVVLKILKTFDVDIIIGPNGFKEALDYNSWREKLLSKPDQNITEQIFKNKKLCDYLEGVINFVNSHPQILNEGMDNNVLDDEYKRKRYVEPKYNSTIISQGLRQAVTNNNMFFPQTASILGQANNTIIGFGPYTTYGPSMTGGSIFGDSREESALRKIARENRGVLLYSLVEKVIKDLGNLGISLDPKDSNLIRSELEKVKEIEKKTLELYYMLRKLVNLKTFLKDVQCDVNTKAQTNISLKSMVKNQKTIEAISRNLEKLQECINNNNGKQEALSNDLMTKLAYLLEMNSH